MNNIQIYNQLDAQLQPNRYADSALWRFLSGPSYPATDFMPNADNPPTASV